MKCKDMADLLEGFATSLKNITNRKTVEELKVASNCFRLFPNETLSSFHKLLSRVKDNNGAAGNGAKVKSKTNRKNDKAITEYTEKIQHFLDNQRDYDYDTLRGWVQQIAKLKVPEVKEIGERVECPLSQRTKKAMLKRLEEWLITIRFNADRSSFTS